MVELGVWDTVIDASVTSWEEKYQGEVHHTAHQFIYYVSYYFLFKKING